jgi:repressor LexA
MKGNEGSKLFYFVVGRNINKYRMMRNYSLQDLAERIGLTKKTIQRYENGEIRIDVDRIADVAEGLQVEVADLIEGAQDFLGVQIGETNQNPLEIEELEKKPLMYKGKPLTDEQKRRVLDILNTILDFPR